MTALFVAVQHHPSRHALVGPLLERLDQQARVVEDPDPDGQPGPLRTYLECLRAADREAPDATHVLVVQDDAWPVVDGLPARAELLVDEKPGCLVAFCVQGTGHHGRTVREAHRRGERWALLRRGVGWTPTIATAWPIEHARRFALFAARHYQVDHLSDDAPVATWQRAARVDAWATVPSLVEHPDVVPSLIPNRRAHAGSNRARVAAVLPPQV